MRAIRVHYEDGDTIETNINGTVSDINTHYLGQVFNLGDGAGGDRMVRAVRVEFLDTNISGGEHTDDHEDNEDEQGLDAAVRAVVNGDDNTGETK